MGRALCAALVCLGAIALSAPAASAADEAAWLFNPDAVVEIDLGGLSQEEIEKLEEEPDEYVPGTFELRVGGVVQGPTFSEVGIRLKGGASFRPLTSGKAAFKVKFDKYVKGQLYFGLKRLTLNNMVQDPSMIHETLTYELFGALGLPASRTGYAFVRVNWVNYGVYLNIETLDKISLPHWFETTQHLYEADLAGTDVRPGEANTFEVDEGSEADISDLEALIAAANDEEGDWSDGMVGVADLREMTRMWAVERYVGHWDGYAGMPGVGMAWPNNYYLHSNAAGVFSMLPWGTDQTWVLPVEFGREAGGILFNRCLADESCRQLYVDALKEVYFAVPPLALDSHAVSLAEQLAPYQAMEEEPRREYTDAQIARSVKHTREFIDDRPRELARWLWPPVPVAASPPAPPVAPSPSPPRIGASRVRGAVVYTRLNVFEAGRAVQRVKARINGHWVKACKGQQEIDRAGELTVRCRISARAQRHLKSGPLRLKVRVDFLGSSGASNFSIRRLTLPRRH